MFTFRNPVTGDITMEGNQGRAETIINTPETQTKSAEIIKNSVPFIQSMVGNKSSLADDIGYIGRMMGRTSMPKETMAGIPVPQERLKDDGAYPDEPKVETQKSTSEKIEKGAATLANLVRGFSGKGSASVQGASAVGAGNAGGGSGSGGRDLIQAAMAATPRYTGMFGIDKNK